MDSLEELLGGAGRGPALQGDTTPDVKAPRSARDALLRELVGDLARVEGMLEDLQRSMPSFSASVRAELDAALSAAVTTAVEQVRAQVLGAVAGDLNACAKAITGATTGLGGTLERTHQLVSEDLKRIEREAYNAGRRGVEDGIKETAATALSSATAAVKAATQDFRTAAQHAERVGRIGGGQLAAIAVTAGIGSAVAVCLLRWIGVG